MSDLTHQSIRQERESWVVNGQLIGQLIYQFPMAAVVVNCPPFRGALTARHPDCKGFGRSPACSLDWFECGDQEFYST